MDAHAFRPRTLNLALPGWLELALLSFFAAAGCSHMPATYPSTAASGGEFPGELKLEPLPSPALHNLLRISDRIYSGGEPVGEAAYAELARLGIRTIVSVDGARPDVDSARQHGLRYVHIPFGYDGIGKEAGLSLARLVRDAEGPFYIHCHHGRHRGPAAAAVACIAAGQTDNAGARKILERAGTSPEYAGLWRDVASYAPPPPGAELPRLTETAAVSSLVAAMAGVDRAHDNLKLCRDANWRTPEENPDLVASREALLLREGLHEANRALAADAEAKLRSWLAGAEELAGKLQISLEAGDAAAAGTQFETLGKSCERCHAEFRN